MEKLSTECLKGLKDRIDSILKERETEENEMDEIVGPDSESISFEERRKLYLDTFEAYIEKFNEMFPLFLEAKRKWLTSETIGEGGGYIQAIPNFRSWEWDNLIQDLKSNRIFIPYVLV